MNTQKYHSESDQYASFDFPEEAQKRADDILKIVYNNKDPEKLLDEIAREYYFEEMPLKHQIIIGAAANDIKKGYTQPNINSSKKVDEFYMKVGIYETERVNEISNRVNKTLKEVLEKLEKGEKISED